MTGPMAIALDELLCSPNYGEYADALRAGAPTALLDQADAAASEVANRIGPTAAKFDLQPRAVHPAECPAWVRLGALHTLTTWAAGRGTTCRHNPNPEHPQPVAAVAWKPDLIVCGHCTYLFALRADSTADRTCDGCGHTCDAAIYPSLIVLGPLVYTFGACDGCRFWSVTDERVAS